MTGDGRQITATVACGHDQGCCARVDPAIVPFCDERNHLRHSEAKPRNFSQHCRSVRHAAAAAVFPPLRSRQRGSAKRGISTPSRTAGLRQRIELSPVPSRARNRVLRPALLSRAMPEEPSCSAYASDHLLSSELAPARGEPIAHLCCSAQGPADEPALRSRRMPDPVPLRERGEPSAADRAWLRGW